MFNREYMEYANEMLNTPHCVLIYCRPPTEIILNASTHEVKSYDTPEHLAYVEQNKNLFIESYDKLMYKLPHIRYNYLVDDANKLVDKVIALQFHLSEWRKYENGQF